MLNFGTLQDIMYVDQDLNYLEDLLLRSDCFDYFFESIESSISESVEGLIADAPGRIKNAIINAFNKCKAFFKKIMELLTRGVSKAFSKLKEVIQRYKRNHSKDSSFKMDGVGHKCYALMEWGDLLFNPAEPREYDTAEEYMQRVSEGVRKAEDEYSSAGSGSHISNDFDKNYAAKVALAQGMTSDLVYNILNKLAEQVAKMPDFDAEDKNKSNNPNWTKDKRFSAYLKNMKNFCNALDHVVVGREYKTIPVVATSKVVHEALNKLKNSEDINAVIFEFTVISKKLLQFLRQYNGYIVNWLKHATQFLQQLHMHSTGSASVDMSLTIPRNVINSFLETLQLGFDKRYNFDTAEHFKLRTNVKKVVISSHNTIESGGTHVAYTLRDSIYFSTQIIQRSTFDRFLGIFLHEFTHGIQSTQATLRRGDDGKMKREYNYGVRSDYATSVQGHDLSHMELHADAVARMVLNMRKENPKKIEQTEWYRWLYSLYNKVCQKCKEVGYKGYRNKVTEDFLDKNVSSRGL